MKPCFERFSSPEWENHLKSWKRSGLSSCWAHVRRKFDDVVKATGGEYKGNGKANGLKPSRYLRYLFEKISNAKTSEDVFNLLPMNVFEIDLNKQS